MTRKPHTAPPEQSHPADFTAPSVSYWLLEGAVQGHGLRPAAVALALHIKLTGWICNITQGVLLAIHGPRHLHNELLDRLITQFSGTATALPAPDSSPATPAHPTEPALAPFHIRHSSDLSPAEQSWINTACRLLSTTCHPGPAVPQDLAICSLCLSEIQQPNHPRENYPLNSCLHCGPRYSVIQNMPWDRGNTALQNWPLCPNCSNEYHSLNNHRSYAQIINCPRCGPQLQDLSESHSQQSPLCPGEQLIQRAAACLHENKILAIQGIGGWQLLCNAASSSAVQRLRDAKQRPHKPLAVMIPSLDCISKSLSPPELEALRSPQNPILICTTTLHSEIAPNVRGPLRSIGIFLPSTALHHLILKYFRHPVVVSSANVEDDPILYSQSEVKHHLKYSADFLLGHQRPILRPVDDSVVRIIAGQPAIIRLARGYAPLPLALHPPQTPTQNHTIVALGGHQKATFAIAGNGRAVLGPHIGDLSSEAVRKRFIQQLDHTLELYKLQPTLLVHDQHPDYFTTAWARSRKLPTIAVQHHHAHAAAALIGTDPNTSALTAVFDGSGYSPDGVVRGGEFLIASHASAQHAASLLPFNLPAPDIAAREPWRSATALIHHSLPNYSAAEIAQCFAQRPFSHHNGPPPDVSDIQPFLNAIDAGAGTPCTSMGRLFDALACIILGTHSNTFEAAAATLLEETAADFAGAGQQLSPHSSTPELQSSHPQLFKPLIPLLHPSHTWPDNHAGHTPNAATAADWRPLIRYIIHAAEQGRASAELARVAHWAIARLVLDVSRQYPHLPVALSGGCFQNRLLTEFTLSLLQKHQRQSLPPNQIPVNDGGLAAGQLAIACHSANIASPVN